MTAILLTLDPMQLFTRQMATCQLKMLGSGKIMAKIHVYAMEYDIWMVRHSVIHCGGHVNIYTVPS